MAQLLSLAFFTLALLLALAVVIDTWRANRAQIIAALRGPAVRAPAARSAPQPPLRPAAA